MTLTGIGKVEHWIMPEACLLLRWVEWYLARLYVADTFGLWNMRKTVEGTYYEYILTDTIANIQIISLTAYDESHPLPVRM